MGSSADDWQQRVFPGRPWSAMIEGPRAGTAVTRKGPPSTTLQHGVTATGPTSRGAIKIFSTRGKRQGLPLPASWLIPWGSTPNLPWKEVLGEAIEDQSRKNVTPSLVSLSYQWRPGDDWVPADPSFSPQAGRRSPDFVGMPLISLFGVEGILRLLGRGTVGR